MQPLNSQHLFTLTADLHPVRDVGPTPLGHRRVFDVKGGRLEGRVNGALLPSGGDWILQVPQDSHRIDVRALAELDDGSLLFITQLGRLVWPAEVVPLLTSHEAMADLDPSRYYCRTAPFFETSSETYRWLNHIVAVGVGRITKTGVAYEIYEVL